MKTQSGFNKYNSIEHDFEYEVNNNSPKSRGLEVDNGRYGSGDGMLRMSPVIKRNKLILKYAKHLDQKQHWHDEEQTWQDKLPYPTGKLIN